MTLGTASVFEVLAYYIPGVDHLLDLVAAPAAIGAGVIASASVMADIPPAVMWPLAIIAGGGVAGLTKGTTALLRAKSGVMTAGLANPVDCHGRDRGLHRHRDPRGGGAVPLPGNHHRDPLLGHQEGGPAALRPVRRFRGWPILTPRASRIGDCAPHTMSTMCLLVLAWMKHPRYRLVVAANRDEFHDRPAAPLAWWNDGVPMMAGRDLAAGGTWLGVTRAGRFGAVTNFRDPGHVPAPDAPSRGTLVPRFLGSNAEPLEFLHELHRSAAGFAGFNLLVGGPRSLCYLSNRADTPARELEPGLYGLSNHLLDSPWPKLLKARSRLATELDGEEPDVAALFDLLADREPADAGELPDEGLPPELQRALSSPFVLHPRYGTRCSTVLLAGHDGRTLMAERRFDRAGVQTGATRAEYAGDQPQ